MGQQQSNTTTAPTATAAVPNVLARDYAGVAVTVHCVEVSNENVQKLQALLASGAPAAELEAALPSERFSGAASSTIADVRAFLEAQQEKSAPPQQQEEEANQAAATTTVTNTVYTFALRRTPNGEDGSGMVTLDNKTQLAELLASDYWFMENAEKKTVDLILLYTTDSKYGVDGEQCCLIALCAACCACCLCCCCA